MVLYIIIITTTTTCIVPTKVSNIGAVQQVSCGTSHTLALSIDGDTIWSFGQGESGRLGHGDTARSLLPKVSLYTKGLPITCNNFPLYFVLLLHHVY